MAAGATSVRAPVAAVFEGGRIAYVADPDGHLWEIAHNPYFPFDDDRAGQRTGLSAQVQVEPGLKTIR